MSEKTKPKSDSAEQDSARSSPWLTYLPLGVFLLIIAAAGIFWTQSQQAKRSMLLEQQQQNEDMGLPRDFPIEVVPFYEGVEILSSERGSAKSMTGEPMDKWIVQGQIDSERKPILDFYNERMIGYGMGQTQFISVPAMDGSGANYQVSFADEIHLVEFYIQKLTTDEITQIELTVYRIRN